MAQRLLKQANLLSILELLRSRREASQNEIAQSLGLQRSTVSNLARELRDRGWLEEVGKRPSGKNGGKPRVLLSLDASAAGIIGFTIRRDHLLSHRFDFQGNTVDVSRHDIDESRPEEAVEAIVCEVRRAFESEPKLRACGIAVSSVVANNGDIARSTDFPWHIPEFREHVASALPGEVALLIENDANCVALHALGRLGINKADAPNIIAFYCSLDPPSLGSGIVVDGVLLRGAHGAAGEIVRRGACELIDSTWDGVYGAVSLIDPDLVIVAGEEDAASVVADLEERIAQAFPAITHKTLVGPDLPSRGVAYLAAKTIVDRISKEGL